MCTLKKGNLFQSLNTLYLQDDKGRQFDKDGNNINWWEAETDKRFKERAQCIIEQYGNYTVPENGLKVKYVLKQFSVN